MHRHWPYPARGLSASFEIAHRRVAVDAGHLFRVSLAQPMISPPRLMPEHGPWIKLMLGGQVLVKGIPLFHRARATEEITRTQ